MIVGIILLDQFSKGAIQSNFSLGETMPIIDGFFNFTYVKNPGAAFGMGAGAHDSIRKPLFLWLPVFICLWLLYMIWKGKEGRPLLSIAFSLIFAGAVGNLIDRFSLDYVVDFLDFYIGTSHFPAFNVADSAISIAAMILIVDGFLEYRENSAKLELKEEKASKTEES